MKIVWYRLDPSDGDVLVLIHYLIAGIRQHFQSFGMLTLKHLREGHPVKTSQQFILTLLLHEMEEVITEHLILALDDFHLIQERSEVKNAMNFLLEHLFERVHFLVIGRKNVPLDITGLIAKRAAFGITEKELAV